MKFPHALAFLAFLPLKTLLAATIICTIDGTVSPPKLTYGNPQDCAFSGTNGTYTLKTGMPPTSFQASCWLDNRGDDIRTCVIGLARQTPDNTTFRIATFTAPIVSPAQKIPAWVSVTFTN